jgi:hypothetical protein
MPSDLGFCAPSGTRTPNPLKAAAATLAVWVILLIWPLASANAVPGVVWCWVALGHVWRDGRGVKRGLSGRLAAVNSGCFVPSVVEGRAGREGRLMRGDEARVVDAFCSYLERDGWTVAREVANVDVKAIRGQETLYAEAKGRTEAIGTDVDTLYGQLLRRVPEDAENDLLGVVVPERALDAALRVPAWIRQRLRIRVFAVSDEGEVREVTGA